ncbi:hypothetical protein Bbelb_367020 [Branchiostoma belcheri]|nr:hypothetical protein Bbelb_367020 [Branchiostoma belcheri]
MSRAGNKHNHGGCTVKVLPCQHTFCQDCLQDHAGRGGTFQCPNCRQQVRLPRQGVAGLPDNRIVANMSDSEVPTTSYTVGGHKRASPVKKQALINEGRGILETYCSFIRGLREEERRLDDQKEQTDNKIDEAYRQACDQIIQRLTEEKDKLLSEVETNHRQNKGAVQGQKDVVWADVAELSSVCDGAEQDMDGEGGQFLSHEPKLAEVVGRFRHKTVPDPLQTHPAVFQPKVRVELVCTLGDVTVPGAAPSATTKTICNQTQFGRCGSEPGQFNWPLGLTEGEGEIFVADLENLRVQVFTLQGTFIRQFPTVVSSGEKMYPDDVARDGEGNLWVVGRVVMSVVGSVLRRAVGIGRDDREFAVQYDKQGSVLRQIELQTGWNRGVAVDTRRNHILITQTTGDWRRHGEVLVFRPDGTLVKTVGQPQGMEYPLYITVDEEGNILVTDYDNHCVYMYNEDGRFLVQFGGKGSGEGQMNGPLGICTDRAGNIIVVDSWNCRVEMFDKTGRFLKHITTDMKSPWAVAMTPQGHLVVTDTKEHTVTIFKHI